VLLSKQRNKWTMTIAGTVLLVMIMILILNYFKYQYQAVVTSERERLTDIADYLDMRFNAYLVGLNLLAGHNDIRYLEADRARPDLLAAAKALDVVNVALYDYKGKLISDCWPLTAQVESPFSKICAKNDFYSVLTGGANVSGRMLDSSQENAYVSVQVPVLGENQVTGVLAAYIPISDISLAVTREVMPERQYVFVMDGSGQFIHHPRLSEFFPESKSFKLRMNELLFQKKGIVETSSPIDGVDKMIIYTGLNNTQWRIGTAIPVSDMYARVFNKALEDAKNFLLLIMCLGLLYGVWYQARRHEQEREQLKLERMMCVNQLAAGIAHEIRNPLTSIQGFIQLMLKRSDKPVPQEHFKIILSEIGRIDSLISEFQMLARPLKDPLIEKVDICKLLNDVLLLMKGQFYDKTIALDLQLPSTGCCFVLGDIGQLKQVFINLVKNALEAVPVGGNVTIMVACQQDMMAITVENDGEGIPLEIIEKLGTPFFTTKANGTGLGLSVCYSIVQNHGGKIMVSSTLGKKTVFTVLLPAALEQGMVQNK